MEIFKKLGQNIDYNDILQIDGSFSEKHKTYNKSPMFNNNNGKNLAKVSIANSASNNNSKPFDGTEKNFKLNDRIDLWKNYWLEYINAFDKLVNVLPNSVVTVFVARQAIEIGFKYLLLKKTNQVKNEHNLENLSNQFFTEYAVNENYMDGVNKFCENYGKYIEGGNVEYFRYPEYKSNNYFAGNNTDMEWLSYNLALILLKLIHYAGLDDKF